MTDKHILEDKIPRCKHCGSKRVFELQLMPTLINFLRFGNRKDEEILDFGCVAVYSCSNSCSLNINGAVVNEFIFMESPL